MPDPPGAAVEGPSEPGLCVQDVHFDFGTGAEVLSGVDLAVGRGEVLSLLGPSGCGKTTLLRVIAGLEVPSLGRVHIGEREVTGPGTLVAPERRRVGMVFQDWALFPHLSVADNVAFGLPRAQRRAASQIEDTLSLVGLAGLGARMPSTLSGGQQQRVALGRALAQRPDALLLDEPFSNLDASLRVRVRTDVHRLLAEIGITTVMVTHDRDEAFVLGDRVALVRDGSILQEGPAEQLYRWPTDEWAARFLGDVVVLEAESDGRTAITALGPVQLTAAVRGPVRVLLRPEQLRLEAGLGASTRATSQPGNAAVPRSGTVDLVEYHGPRTSYDVNCAGLAIRVDAPGPPVWNVGDPVAVHLPEEPVHAFVGS